jgi:sarcosine oxidase subunit gamma
MSAVMADRHSPLEEWADRFAALPRSLRVAEVPFCEMLNLRLDADAQDGPAPAGIAAVLGGPLPLVPCTAKRYDTRDVAWLGPDEWLVISEPGAESIDAQLRAAINAIGSAAGAVTDVSAQRTVLTVAGPAAADVLAGGCAIDLHPQVAPAGTCVQTLLARCGVTIIVRDDSATRFTLLVRASFAGYLADWLVDAAIDLMV